MGAGQAECIFCRIANGQIPAHRVYEDQRVVAFLDAAPLAAGHVLVVPKTHYATMADAPPEIATSLGGVLPRLVRAVQEVAGVAGVNVLQNNGRAAGQEVPHIHIHLIPRRGGDGLGYRWKPTEYAAGQAESIREKFSRVLAE